jgi:hypothetical protein
MALRRILDQGLRFFLHKELDVSIYKIGDLYAHDPALRHLAESGD